MYELYPQAIIDLRNVLVHDYLNIDPEIITRIL